VDADPEDIEDDLELSVEIRDEILISKALHQSEVHAEEEKGLLHNYDFSLLRGLRVRWTYPLHFLHGN